ncbi:hypothetical protein [Mangrovicella endophytica]|uniref:hypothetical protein n=1 Tax=Mangrovicella endophytica TaxID=2066697 RepID=UPI000C9E3209|nr:hypothetical protein [Mangrovicella endophytica]
MSRFSSFRSLMLASLMLLPSLPASAEIDRDKIAASTAAVDELVAQSGKGAQPPRLAQSEVSALFDRIFDASALGDAPLTLDEIRDTAPLAVNGSRVLFLYMLAGTGASQPAQLPRDAATARKIDANIVGYAPEIGRVYDFTAHLQGAYAEGMASFRTNATAQQLEDVEKGTLDMRKGIRDTFAAILQGIAAPDYPIEWRRERAKAAADAAPKIAQILMPAESSILRERAKRAASKAGDEALAADLTRFANAL